MLKVWKFHVLPRLRQIRQVHLSRQQSGTRCQVCPELPEMSDDTIIINHHVVWRHMKIPYLLYGEFNVWCKTNHSSLYISILDIFRCVGTFELWVSLRIEFRMATAIWDLQRYPKLLLQVWFRKYWSWNFMDLKWAKLDEIAQGDLCCSRREPEELKRWGGDDLSLDFDIKIHQDHQVSIL